jgi:hypothetical protein
MLRARGTAAGLVTSRAPNVPRALKLVRTRSGADRIEVIAEVARPFSTTAVTSYPPDGVEVLERVGVGVGLGAGVGDFVGGAIVGEGCGADDEGPAAGCELFDPPPAGADDAERPAAGRPDLLGDADGVALAARPPADGVGLLPLPLAPCPAD